MAAVRISVDCTGPATVAVLRHRDGHVEPLRFDGATELPSGVYQDDDGLLTGRAALDAATARPERYVAAPLHQIAAGDTGAAALTALLARVREQATRTATMAVTQAVIVVPPGWGPQRRTRLRHNAHRAGLTDIEIVDAATALARHHMRTQGPAVALVCRSVGGAADATILRGDPGQFEALATIDRAHVPATDGNEAAEQLIALARQTLDAADFAASDITAVVLAAPPTLLTGIAARLRQLGITAPVRTAATTDAAYGALNLTASPAPTRPPRQTRHAVAIAVPLTGAAVLLWLLLNTALFPPAEPLSASGPPSPLEHWPAWSMIVVLVCFGTLATVLHRAGQRWKQPAQDTEAQCRDTLARGLHITASVTVAAALITAMLGAASIPRLPVPILLLWTLGPALVLAGVAGVVAALIRQGHTSALRWQIWLRLPNLTVLLAVAGLLAVQLDLYLRQHGSTLFPVAAHGNPTGLDRLGTIAAALAILPILLRRIEYQILVSPLVIAVVLLTHSFTSTSLIIGALLLAACGWWIGGIRPASAYSNPNPRHHPCLRSGTSR